MPAKPKEPHQNIAPNGLLNVASDLVKDIPTISPGVRGKLKLSLDNINKGSRVILYQNNSDKNSFIVTPYEIDTSDTNKDLPETLRSIIPGKSYSLEFKGPTSKIIQLDEEQYVEVDAPLFPQPGSPTLDEVNQLGLPDCAFLAAIQAVLNHPNGDSFIRGMMHQNEEGDITVRLFNPKTGIPEYVKVKSEVLVDVKTKKPVNSHTALWVHALESAYAARGIKGIETYIHNKSVSTVSTSITPDVAFKTLTGINTDTVNIKSYNKSPADIPHCLTMTHNEIKIQALKIPNENVLLDFVKETLDAEKSIIKALLDAFPEKDEEDIIADYAKLIILHEKNSERFAQIKNNKPGEQDKNLAAFYAQIQERLKPAGAPFTNTYNAHQLKIFNDLKQSISEHKLLVTTIKDFNRDPGEPRIPVVGLHDIHAYTILGVNEKMKKVANSLGVINDVPAKFVVLRNPWGRSGRGYEGYTEKAVETQEGVFEIELSEYCRYFHAYYFNTDSVNALFKSDALKEKTLAEIEDFLRTEPAADSDKNEIKEQYDTCKQSLESLIKLELSETNRIRPEEMKEINRIFDLKGADTKDAIKSLIDIKLFSHIRGTEQQVTSHVFYLLKLQWIRNQSPVDLLEEKNLVNQIKENLAYPHLWEKLKEREASLNTVIYSNLNMLYKQTNKYTQELDGLVAAITGEIKADKEHHEKIKEVMLVYFTLKKVYNQLCTMNIFATPNAPFSNELRDAISGLNTILKKYQETFTNETAHPFVKQHFEYAKINYEQTLRQSLDLEAPMTGHVSGMSPVVPLPQDQGLIGRKHYGLYKPKPLEKTTEELKSSNKKVVKIFPKSTT